MAVTEVSNFADLVVDFTIDPVGSGGAGVSVPLSRLINTTAPLTGGGDLSADRTLALTTSPTGQTPVGVTRTLTTTSPLQIGGGASADLSANRTLSVLQFGSANAGVVPQTGVAGAGYFLEATGNWIAGVAAGVSTLTGTAPIVVSTPTGNPVVSISAANLTTPGYVPAVGSVEPTKFLQKANPPVWAVPGTGAFVSLQATYPGTADSGNAHITGVLGAQTALVAGSAKKSMNGVGNENLYVKQSSPSNPSIFASYYAGSPDNGITFLSARGTEASPGQTQNGDQLAHLALKSWFSGTTYAEVDFLKVNQIGGMGASHTPYAVFLASQDSVGGRGYIYLKQNSLIGVGTFTPLSGFEVGTSLGLKVVVLSGSSPTISNNGDDQSMYMCDASAAGFQQDVTIPTASGRLGRICGFMKIDATTKPIILTTTGGQTVGPLGGVDLVRPGESIILQSDGSNWQILTRSYNDDRWSNAADGSALVNSTVETEIANIDITVSLFAFSGTVSKLRAAGTLSTSGTPTLRFKMKNQNSETVCDSGAITMPSGVTDAIWQMELVLVDRDGTTNRVVAARLWIGQAAGVGAEMKCYNMYDLSLAGALSAASVPNAITAQWGTAHASNSVTCMEFVRSMVNETALV